MNWHHASNFFSMPDATELQKFLYSEECVWNLLDRVRDFVSSVIKPNVRAVRDIGGGFIKEPTAIFQNEVLTGHVTYDLQDASGYFRVCHSGKELENAALLLPGAFLGDDGIEICDGVLIESAATVYGPAVLGPGTTVRQGAYVRGSVFTEPNALIGHATEIKNAVMLNNAKAGHFAYIGDSIVGKDANLGAGTKLANLKMSYLPYRFIVEGRSVEVERRKFGAMLGDGVETGCNSVTNPGALIGQNSKIWPNATVKSGYYSAFSVIK
jgi:carbonic anhydrase/acetyltransferase-like protein (isoleucine patch superfamily)